MQRAYLPMCTLETCYCARKVHCSCQHMHWVPAPWLLVHQPKITALPTRTFFFHGSYRVRCLERGSWRSNVVEDRKTPIQNVSVLWVQKPKRAVVSEGHTTEISLRVGSYLCWLFHKALMPTCHDTCSQDRNVMRKMHIPDSKFWWRSPSGQRNYFVLLYLAAWPCKTSRASIPPCTPRTLPNGFNLDSMLWKQELNCPWNQRSKACLQWAICSEKVVQWGNSNDLGSLAMLL